MKVTKKTFRSLDIAMTSGHLQFTRLAQQFAASCYEYPRRGGDIIYDFIRCLRHAFRLPIHDVYLSTGHTMAVFPLAFRKAFLRKKFILIVCSNDRFFHFLSFPIFQRLLHKWISRYIDGVIAVSDMVKGYVQKNTSLPVKVVNTFLKDNSYLKIQPNLSSHNIVSIGTDYPGKGNDILIRIDKQLRENSFEGHVFVLGEKKNIPQFIKKYAEPQSRFHFVGYVDPKSYLASSCFYVHPARFDAAPASVLEAMAAGLIPLVSETTGIKDLVENVSPKLVVKNDPRSFYLKISDLMSKEKHELKRLSEKAKEIASAYTFDKIEKDFKEALMGLLENSLAKVSKTSKDDKYVRNLLNNYYGE